MKELPLTHITPRPDSWSKRLEALWGARRLVYWLVRRDLMLRYRQTMMGWLWAILYPLGLFGIYVFALGYLAKLPMPDGTSYAVYILTGLAPWIYFQNALLMASGSLQQNLGLISKVYFPRLVLIVVAFATATLDFLWMALVLLGATWYYGVLDMGALDTLLAWSITAGILGLGLGVLISSWIVRFRDLSVALPIVLQMIFFLSPIVYSAHLVPPQYLHWYYFNPLSAIADSFRAAFGFTNAVEPVHQLTAIAVALIAMLLALRHFHVLERELVDGA